MSGGTEQMQSPAAVLEKLDPHMFTSQIPVSSSRGRRNSTTGAGLTDMINKSLAKHGNVNKRKNFRSTVAGSRATDIPRFSFGSSNAAPQRHSFAATTAATAAAMTVTTTTTTTTTSRDPRPLRDKNFQSAMQQEILEYITNNNFDIETNHPVSMKFLKQPTQKGFVILFKWLYSRLDPGYSFTKSIEQEVYQILRHLQYPYLDTINKSQISAVGGSGWPKFLGMLHWLVRTNIKLDQSLNRLDQSIMNQNTQDLTILNQPLETLEEQEQKKDTYELMIERTFIDYVTNCYKSFLKLEDDYTPHMEQLRLEFDRFRHIIRADISNIQEVNNKYFVECQNLEIRYKELRESREKNKALTSDLEKFEKYVHGMELKSHEWDKKLEKMQKDSSQRQTKINELKEAIIKLESELSQKHKSIDVVDKKLRQKEKLKNDIEAASEESDKLVSTIRTTQIELESVYRALSDTLRQYRTSMSEVFRIRRDLGHNIDESAFQLIFHDELSRDGSIAIQYDNLIEPSSKEIKQVLENLQTEIKQRLAKSQKDTATYQKTILELNRELQEKMSVLKQKSNELRSLSDRLEKEKTTYDRINFAKRVELEKRQKQISQNLQSIDASVKTARNELQRLQNIRQETIQQIDHKRLRMHTQVNHIAELVTTFQMQTKESLEHTLNSIANYLHQLN